MKIDAANVPTGAVLKADVCIVGGGPVGLALASELQASGQRVCILESGGERPSSAGQRLNQGSNVGRRYMRLDRARFRALGGNSHKWFRFESAWAVDGGLRCLPLRPIDYEVRAGVPFSGWPIGSGDLEPAYGRARELCGLPSAEAEAASNDGAPFALDPSRIEPVVFQFGAEGAFGRLGQRLSDAPSVQIVLNATATSVKMDAQDPKHTSRIEVARPDGRRFEVEARVFVLAAGGIENARLLLLSGQTQPGGLGNGSGLAGRFFMEHLHANLGVLRSSAPDFWARAGFYERCRVGPAAELGAFALSPEVMRAEGLLGVVISPFVTYEGLFSRPFAAFMRLRQGLLDRSLPPAVASDLSTLLRRPFDVARAVAMVRTRRFPSRRVFGLVVQAEQAPNPDSRVTLSDRVDHFGLRQVQLDWRLGANELRSVRRAQSLLDAELRRAGLGSIDTWFGAGDADRLVGTWHHMGTTRMHPDAAQGVVDRDCRVHGTANLFVAGSSVFPTSGAATVTLTSVALAVRLARHLRTSLAQRDVVAT